MFEKEDLYEIACRTFQERYEKNDRSGMYTLGFGDGYNKANEWHYVKDGDLPPERLEGKQILVVPQKHKFTEPMFVVGYYLLSEYRVGMEKKFYFDSDCRDEIDKPYAWKEIVFPEEEVENESHT